MTLSHAERVDSLLALLSLDEKIGLIAPDPSLGSTCFAHIHAIPRVGLPEYGEITLGAAYAHAANTHCHLQSGYMYIRARG
jgi:hypothetical protein